MSDVIADIKRAMRGESGRELDDLIAGLPHPFDPARVPELLGTLDDDTDWPEVAFGIVHAAESVSTESYIAGFLDVSPSLATSAPEWYRTVLVRILNSPQALDRLCSALAGSASEVECRTVVAVAHRAVHDDPDRFVHAAGLIDTAIESRQRRGGNAS